MPKKLGVLVVTYNQLEKTRIWIKNFYSKHIDNPYIKLLILDNHSTDNTYYTLKNEFPTLDIRLLKSNYGCTKGRNIGIAELFDLGCDIYCGFDPDVLIEDSAFFEKVIDFLNYHPDLDGFSPVLRFYEDMSIQGLGHVLNAPFKPITVCSTAVFGPVWRQVPIIPAMTTGIWDLC